MNKINVLLAEDEVSLAKLVKESLESKHFNVTIANDGRQAIELYKNTKFDILVLDIMMPKIDGFTLLQEVRLKNREIPVLFLSAKSQAHDVVKGFELGANDYLKKPFSIIELIVRIHNLIKKSSLSSEIDAFGNFKFNVSKQTLQYKNEEKQILTHREASLLNHLLKNKNNVLERDFVLKELWGKNDFFNARSMDVFITKLRKKLKKDESVKIVNVRGFGYKLICD
jgi:DNA-binding response OmpR family regulator